MNQNFPDLENIVRNEFESFEPNVNPALWDKISANIPSAASSAAVATKTGLSAIAKVFIGATSALLLSAATYMITSSDSDKNTQQVSEQSQLTVKENTESAEVSVTPLNESTDQNKIETVATAEQSKLASTTKAAENNAVTIGTKKSTQQQNAISGNTNEKDFDHIKHNHEAVSTSTNTKSNSAPAIGNQNEPIVKEEKLNDVVGATVEGRAYPISIITANPAGGYAPLQVALSSYLNLEDVQWDFGDNEMAYTSDANHIFEEAGTYTIQLTGKTKDGKQITEKTTIEVKASLSSLKLPQVFTPNNDNVNDIYIADSKGLQSFSMTIYSINGQLVFESNNQEMGWDGTMQDGSPAPNGTYMCIVVGSGIDNKLYNSRQTIQLIR